MHKDNKMVINPSLPYEYSIAVYVLEELCAQELIDVFELSSAISELRKEFNLPTISIYGKKDNYSRD